jgi:hypothetical protein
VLERGKLISPKDDGSMMIEARGVSKHYGQLQDPVTEVRIALGPPASPMEPELSEEAKPGGGDREGSESRAVEADKESRSAPDAVRSPEVDETRVLRIALKPGESGQYLLHGQGSAIVAEVGQWSIRPLLGASAEEFPASRSGRRGQRGRGIWGALAPRTASFPPCPDMFRYLGASCTPKASPDRRAGQMGGFGGVANGRP